MPRLCQPARIRALCGAAAQSVAIEVVQQTGSTNADLLARAASLTGPLLLLAHDQTAGRGRAGRSWLSSPEGSLTFSLAWPFHCPLQELIGLPLTIGVALADAFAQLNIVKLHHIGRPRLKKLHPIGRATLHQLLAHAAVGNGHNHVA